MTTRSSPYRTTSCSTISVRAQSRTACWLWGLRRDITESTSPPFTTSQYESLLPLPLRAAFLMSPQTSNSKQRFLVHDLALPLRHFSSFPKVQASRPRTSCISFLSLSPTPPRPLYFVSVSPKRSIIFFSCISPPFKPPLSRTRPEAWDCRPYPSDIHVHLHRRVRKLQRHALAIHGTDPG